MPGPEWMRVHYPQEKWSTAYTANVSIGQGYVLASPLQMAMAYATVANGGIAYEPRLVKKVLTPEGKPALDDERQRRRARRSQKSAPICARLSPRQQMTSCARASGKWSTNRAAPGGKARLKNIVVAGKTGSAQATDRGNKETIAWFCCFAPFDNPRYVDLHGWCRAASTAAASPGPIAAHILEQCLAMDQGTYTVELAELTPAHSDHPFATIEALDYKRHAARSPPATRKQRR